jgi:ribosome recycling factor
MSQTFNTVPEVEAYTKTRMEKVSTDLQHELSHIRTGRASVNLLDSVRVEAYGSMSPISHVATLHVPEPALITIQPYDSSQIKAIEKAIMSSDLGLNPSNDGKLIRVPIPPINAERRKDLVKKVHHVSEEHRVALRNIRRDSNEIVKKLLKDKLISEDDDRRAHDEIQKLTDAGMKRVDAQMAAKEKEITELK